MRTFIYLGIFFGLIFVPYRVFAAVSGPCSNCHTMHYSQDGQPLGTDGPHQHLLIEKQGGHHSSACVTCHSSQTSSTYEDLGGCKVPIVFYYGSSEPTEYLAGGNFWWVKEGLGADDTKGHNVFLGEDDDNLSEAPGNSIGTCGTDACHINLSQPYSGSDMVFVLNGKYGCQGCHLNVKHHAKDHANFESGLVDSADEGWYRFLSGHGFTGKGVKGYEYKDWEAGHPNLAPGGTAHNEYIGNPTATGYGFQQSGGAGDGVTAFCTGCHGNFSHGGQGSSSPWIRHPSDAVIPDSGEYANVGGDTHLYDPLSPVGKQDISDETPDTTVTPGSDVVMCLSCHRPHGSPYPDLLRWDYLSQQAGGGGEDKGCFYCHTQKND
ncbi:MAG TPA: hypothetical protein ENI35_03700 [Candidatus Desulfofervidus auxilii]|uniref:Doubled CXXCH motif domain-containing protein n=1 Tax=Desulfofervidus auxilii TaxID=1621989 RepID=A0A7C1VUI2_DESA2|nr:hypothetical protein [Candidatus Desulfofervidus auxilii]